MFDGNQTLFNTIQNHSTFNGLAKHIYHIEFHNVKWRWNVESFGQPSTKVEVKCTEVIVRRWTAYKSMYCIFLWFCTFQLLLVNILL